MKFCDICSALLMPLIGFSLLASCGFEKSVSDSEIVPGDAVVVRVADFGRLFRKAGSVAMAGKGSFDEPASRVVELFVEPELRDPFAAVATVGDGIDLSEVIGFTTASGRKLMAAPVKNADKIEALIDSLGNVVEADGYRYADMGDCIVAVGDGYCWIADSYDVLRDARAGARENGFSALRGINDFLSGDSDVRVAVNCAGSPVSFLGGADKWVCLTLDASDLSVNAKAMVMDRDGQCDSIGNNFTDIDTNFLQYTPDDAAVVLAYGKFTGNERGLCMLLGRFAPVHMAGSDGTTSLYAVPASGNPDAVAEASAGSWNVATMTHVPEEMLDDRLRKCLDEVPSARMADGGDQWYYTDGDGVYYFGAFDGCLVFSSNREISPVYGSSFEEDFAGKKAAMVIAVPLGSVLAKAWKMPYGVMCKVGVDDTSVKARITFGGTGKTALQALLGLPQLPDVDERLKAVMGC